MADTNEQIACSRKSGGGGPLTGSRILIVEDEAITAMELEETLKRRGYEIAGTASSGAAAIRIAKEAWPDLILMDIRIEGKIDGIETANQINLFHDIPIIFLTAYSDDATLSRAIRTRSHSFMLKPFNEKELYSNIELAIRKHRELQKSVTFGRIADSMFDLIPEGIVGTDSAGVIRRVNATAEKMIGKKKDELIGRTLPDAAGFISAHRDLIAKLIDSAGTAGTGAGARSVMVMLHDPGTGEKRTLSVRIEPALLPGGAVSEIIFIFSPAAV